MIISRDGWVAITAVSTLVANFLTLCAITVREIILAVRGSKRRPDDTAGAKSAEYWKLEYRQSLKEGIVPIFDALIRMESQHVEILRQIAEILKILRSVRHDQRIRRDSDKL